jgi:hypothetical protein
MIVSQHQDYLRSFVDGNLRAPGRQPVLGPAQQPFRRSARRSRSSIEIETVALPDAARFVVNGAAQAGAW